MCSRMPPDAAARHRPRAGHGHSAGYARDGLPQQESDLRAAGPGYRARDEPCSRRPSLCVLPGRLHNRRSAAEPARIRRASPPLACDFTLGSLITPGGIATNPPVAAESPAPVAHHPWRDRNLTWREPGGRPMPSRSSPLEGSQHVQVPVGQPAPGSLITPGGIATRQCSVA